MFSNTRYQTNSINIDQNHIGDAHSSAGSLRTGFLLVELVVEQEREKERKRETEWRRAQISAERRRKKLFFRNRLSHLTEIINHSISNFGRREKEMRFV